MERKSVLFLCVSNTARSLMAEAILRGRAADRFEVYSAGLRPGIEVPQETLAVLEEGGYDTSGLHSKSVDGYLGCLHPDHLITVCDTAERDCPNSWFMGSSRLSWPVKDPDRVKGDAEARLAAFRAARDEIAARVQEWLDAPSERPAEDGSRPSATENAAEPERVLFLCTGNTARSIMGEAILRQLAGDRYEAHSAGLAPSEVRPETIAVLQEAGYGTSGLHSKAVDDYLGHVFVHYLITVCDHAERNCPRIWPQGGQRVFWPVDDPAAVEGTEQERLAAFRAARDDMRERIDEWLESRSEDARAGER